MGNPKPIDGSMFPRIMRRDELAEEQCPFCDGPYEPNAVSCHPDGHKTANNYSNQLNHWKSKFPQYYVKCDECEARGSWLTFHDTPSLNSEHGTRIERCKACAGKGYFETPKFGSLIEGVANTEALAIELLDALQGALALLDAANKDEAYKYNPLYQAIHVAIENARGKI